MRRVFLIGSILYFLRSITMYVTVLPVSSTTYYCSPKSNHTEPLEIAKRVVQLMSGFGLSINGKHTYCGDFIYSGHTVSLVLGYLTICECNYPTPFALFSFCSIVVGASILFAIVHCVYGSGAISIEFSRRFVRTDMPRRFSVLQWVSWLIAIVGVFLVLLAHGHYTIDILVAYYITTRLFWTYHTLTNNAFLIKVSVAPNWRKRFDGANRAIRPKQNDSFWMKTPAVLLEISAFHQNSTSFVQKC